MPFLPKWPRKTHFFGKKWQSTYFWQPLWKFEKVSNLSFYIFWKTAQNTPHVVKIQHLKLYQSENNGHQNHDFATLTKWKGGFEGWFLDTGTYQTHNVDFFWEKTISTESSNWIKAFYCFIWKVICPWKPYLENWVKNLVKMGHKLKISMSHISGTAWS